MHDHNVRRSPYDICVSPIEDEVLLAIRTSPVYRIAIWLTRLADLVLLPVVVWGVASDAKLAPTLPVPVFILTWTVGMTALLSAMALFYRSSAPFESKGLSWPIDRRLIDVIMRDVLWHRPR